MNMCKKTNELLRKQQRPAKNHYVMLEAFMINSILLMIFCWLQAMLTDRLHRKSTSKKKIQIKAWYRIIGTGILSSEEFHSKLCKSQRKTNYTQQNENSLDTLASNLSYS